MDSLAGVSNMANLRQACKQAAAATNELAADVRRAAPPNDRAAGYEG